jgi:hypothetical protein
VAKTAKAKDPAADITGRVVNPLIKKILDEYGNLESARGSYMNKARRIRESIGRVLEEGVARGIPARVLKLQIKVEQTQAKLRAEVEALEKAEQYLLQAVVKAHDVAEQLALFKSLPRGEKPKPIEVKKVNLDKKASAKSEPVSDKPTEKKYPGVTGAELGDNVHTLKQAADQAAAKEAAEESAA